MRDYIIMTDSCCSLNRREGDELGITVLPLSFTMEGKTYLLYLLYKLLQTTYHVISALLLRLFLLSEDRRRRGLHDCGGQRRPVHRRDDIGADRRQGYPVHQLFERTFHDLSVRVHRGGGLARGAPGGEDHRDRLSLRLPRAGHAHLPHSARAAREKSRH